MKTSYQTAKLDQDGLTKLLTYYSSRYNLTVSTADILLFAIKTLHANKSKVKYVDYPRLWYSGVFKITHRSSPVINVHIKAIIKLGGEISLKQYLNVGVVDIEDIFNLELSFNSLVIDLDLVDLDLTKREKREKR